MAVITLLTDFGLQDGYPGVMKGVIWKIAPGVQIADITHSIKPQGISQGALALARVAPYFPVGTIHVVVVDPGVGTHRRPIALHLGEQFFVGPDNGIFTRVIERAEAQDASIQLVHLDRSQYWLPVVSHSFHGRDIFAPVAAHLAQGIALADMGTLIQDPIRLSIPRPQPLPTGGWRGEVIEIDTFGNLSTNIEEKHLQPMRGISVHVAGKRIDGLVNAFGDRPPGTLVALYGTAHDLIISIVNGNAARSLSAAEGGIVEVIPVP